MRPELNDQPLFPATTSHLPSSRCDGNGWVAPQMKMEQQLFLKQSQETKRHDQALADPKTALNLVREARYGTRARQGCCLRAMLIAQPHDLSAKRRMLELTCHLLFPDTDRAKTSPLQQEHGKLRLILRSRMPRNGAELRHQCCSKAVAAGRSPGFGRTKWMIRPLESHIHLQQHMTGL